MIIFTILGSALIFIICLICALNARKKDKNYKTPLIVSAVIYGIAALGAFVGGEIFDAVLYIIIVLISVGCIFAFKKNE